MVGMMARTTAKALQRRSLIVLQLLLLFASRNAHAFFLRRGRVTGLKLVRSPGGELVTNLVDGTVVYLNGTTPALTVVATTSGRRIPSVDFGWNAKLVHRTEKSAPYALCGGKSYTACADLKAGSHVIKATIARSNWYQAKFTIESGFPPGVTPPSQPSAPKAPAVGDPPLPTPPAPVPLPGAPIVAPTRPPTMDGIYINCGGNAYVDANRILVGWMPDTYFTGGTIWSMPSKEIENTADDDLYRDARFGASMQYNIPVANGVYEIHLLFAETNYTNVGDRVFGVQLETTKTPDIDIVQLAGGAFDRAVQVDTSAVVRDGTLSIQFLPKVKDPMISAMYLLRLGDAPPSQAPVAAPTMVPIKAPTKSPVTPPVAPPVKAPVAVAPVNAPIAAPIAGPVSAPAMAPVAPPVKAPATAPAPTPMAPVKAPTKAPAAPVVAMGAILINCGSSVSFTDSKGRVFMADQYFENGQAEPPTTESIAGTDDDGLYQTYRRSKDWENLKYAIPVKNGEYDVITHFAEVFWNENEARVFTVEFKDGQGGEDLDELDVFVEAGGKNKAIVKTFEDIAVTDGKLNIEFNVLVDAGFVSAIEVIKVGEHLSHAVMGSYFAVDLDGNGVESVSVNTVESHTHGPGSSLLSYTWKKGADVIGSGVQTQLSLPVGDNLVSITVVDSSGSISTDESVIRVPSDVRARVRLGRLVVDGRTAFVYRASFCREERGEGGFGVVRGGASFVGLPGSRLIYGLFDHDHSSIGRPLERSSSVGRSNRPLTSAIFLLAIGCGELDRANGVSEGDKLVLLKKGGYYGHANRKRGATDPRQCIWRSSNTTSTADYTAPLVSLKSSTNGIIEYEADHFNGQLRGNLILSKYKEQLFRVILSPDGQSVNPFTNPPVELAGYGGLAVTQAPDGSLVDARHATDEVYHFTPVDAAPSSVLQVLSVFPRRGRLLGASKLLIFGVNFSGSPDVKIGGNPCTNVVLVNAKKLECQLPAGGTVGRKDVVVTIGATSDTFVNGYRYITGTPL